MFVYIDCRSTLDSTISIHHNSVRGSTLLTSAKMSSADNVLESTHVVEEKTRVKEEIANNEGQQQKQSQRLGPESIRRRKIFVGGLPSGISEEEFRKHFERFGTITDVVVMQDSVTGRPRGFGFVTFDSEKSVEDVLVKTFHDLNGKQVEVKRVVPKVEINVSSGFENSKVSMEKFPSFGTKAIQASTTFPWYYNNELYALNPYGYWGLMDGYRGNGGAVPYDPFSNIWYMPLVPVARPFQQPLAYCCPSYAFVGGYAGH
ncbi:heterogeneous nuclear ribonucleoprotein 1-like [Abrus precatorius]|uniref:Heterogeneous nuclear ribonucleoprotein 1-like n=1 Tax=Abrus precatorius TaxID=3816 RepID=A0A8B8MHT6_ABRPR|nr:heterogeneous nuclear ribonucleoprotein 1-like [Abrus precatorius]